MERGSEDREGVRERVMERGSDDREGVRERESEGERE